MTIPTGDLALLSASMPDLSWRDRIDAVRAAVFAVLRVDVDTDTDTDTERQGPFCGDMWVSITGTAAATLLTRRPNAERVYVIYWPGMLEIPWPEGMTAVQAVEAWIYGLRTAQRVTMTASDGTTP